MELDAGTAEAASAPPVQSQPTASRSIKALAIRASVWAVAGEGASQILRLASSLIVTRLLFPEAFGVMGLAIVVVTGLNMFLDFGIRPVIVQSKQGDNPTFVDTAWTCQVVRGAAISLCSFLMAWPVSWFYREPLLLYVLPAYGLTSLIEGFQSTKVYTCDRHLSVGRPTIVNLSSSLLGTGVMIVWAIFAPSIWALVAGTLTTASSRVLLSHAFLPGRGNRFRWDPEARRELMKFGKWVVVSSSCSFWAAQLDRLLFGKMIPFGMLGLYEIGYKLARLPGDVTNCISSAVAMPAFSRVRDRDGRFGSAYRRLHSKLLLIGGAGVSFLVLLGPSVVRFLYDARYHDAGWMLQLIALAVWFDILQSPNAAALWTLGQPKWVAVASASKIASILALVPLAYAAFGFPGALAAVVLAEMPRYLVVAFFARRSGLPGWGTDMGITGLIILCCLGALALERVPPASVGYWTKVLIALGGFLAVWSPAALWSLRSEKAAS